MITLIAAIGKNREIGNNNKLPWNIPEDMLHFKNYTMGKVVVMGRKTYASIGSRPLPGRKCIVISTQNLHASAVTAHSIADIQSIEHCYPEIVVIGGATIYEQMMGIADKLVITHVDSEFVADTFFPAIDQSVWKVSTEKVSFDSNYRYRFVEYIK